MPKPRKHLQFTDIMRMVATVMLLGVSCIAVAQDRVLEAEHQPLAPQSLLLDLLDNGAGRLVAVGERGHVIYRDGEGAWLQADTVPTRATLTTITGTGDLLWAAGHDAVIMHSADGGRNWVLQNADPQRQQPVMDIYFTDEQTGYALGAYGLMLRTSDGGATWEDHYVSDEEWHLNGLVDLGGGVLVIAGEAGYSYRSEDNGETWEVVELPYQGSMFGAVEVNGCVIAYGLRGNVLQSCDAGLTWEELESGIESSLAGAATEGRQLIMVGNSGAILLRDAQGQFRSEIHSSGVDFAAVLPLGDGRYLLVGEDGSHHYPEAPGAP